MLIILPIMLCCTAQKSTYYACINAQHLLTILHYGQYLCLSLYALLPILNMYMYR